MKRDYSRTIRQGDVYLLKVELDEAEQHRAVINNRMTAIEGHAGAYGFCHIGEGGGHAHVIERAKTVLGLGRPVIQIEAVTEALRHIALAPSADEGHETKEVPPGFYEVRIQRVWSPRPNPVTRDRWAFGD